MKPRKTVDMAFLKDAANKMLLRKDVTDDFRRGIYVLLEVALHETHGYQGFNYVSWIDKDGRERSGVEQWRIDCGVDGENHEKVFAYPKGLEKLSLPTEPYLGNPTRRHYY